MSNSAAVSNSVVFELDQRGVATVTLNNPEKHNAFDDVIIAQLTAMFAQINQDQNVKLMVLAANGKNFSAGGDLNWMKRMVNFSYEENLADAKKLAVMLQTLNTLCVPTIARVQGAAYGGAVGLASCCDMVVASDTASFCLSEVKVGIAPATISPYVIAAIGARASRRYFLTAERFSADIARSLGLVSEVTSPEQLDVILEKFIVRLLANSPNAIKISKQLIGQVEHRNIDQQLMHETSDVIARLRASEQGQEGLSAFFEKRSPSWQQSSPE
ncbi:MAG: enoyl-CoA hydratase/isomerase family protein [Arenicella sp.]|nr:enoyl-CoA hydratase/isomerase family protein [Arenicella sp.]